MDRSALHASPTRYEIAAWILAGLALFFVLYLHLLPALLAGLANEWFIHNHLFSNLFVEGGVRIVLLLGYL